MKLHLNIEFINDTCVHLSWFESTFHPWIQYSIKIVDCSTLKVREFTIEDKHVHQIVIEDLHPGHIYNITFQERKIVAFTYDTFFKYGNPTLLNHLHFEEKRVFEMPHSMVNIDRIHIDNSEERIVSIYASANLINVEKYKGRVECKFSNHNEYLYFKKYKSLKNEESSSSDKSSKNTEDLTNLTLKNPTYINMGFFNDHIHPNYVYRYLLEGLNPISSNFLKHWSKFLNSDLSNLLCRIKVIGSGKTFTSAPKWIVF
jgi:hypothetical protein